MELGIGKIYDVNSSRKGDFRIKLISQCETWATGVIIEGRAKAINEYNERERGEEVTMRKELTKFTEVKS